MNVLWNGGTGRWQKWLNLDFQYNFTVTNCVDFFENDFLLKYIALGEQLLGSTFLDNFDFWTAVFTVAIRKVEAK